MQNPVIDSSPVHAISDVFDSDPDIFDSDAFASGVPDSDLDNDLASMLGINPETAPLEAV